MVEEQSFGMKTTSPVSYYLAKEGTNVSPQRFASKREKEGKGIWRPKGRQSSTGYQFQDFLTTEIRVTWSRIVLDH